MGMNHQWGSGRAGAGSEKQDQNPSANSLLVTGMTSFARDIRSLVRLHISRLHGHLAFKHHDSELMLSFEWLTGCAGLQWWVLCSRVEILSRTQSNVPQLVMDYSFFAPDFTVPYPVIYATTNKIKSKYCFDWKKIVPSLSFTLVLVVILQNGPATHMRAEWA